jgi:tRNA(Ile)-lysidine synthase
MTSRVEQALEKFFQSNLSPWPSDVIVAYSGGIDSHVLLHAMAQWMQRHAFPFSCQAIYIDHQLSPYAAAWAKHCQAICQSLNIDYGSFKVELNAQRGQSLEALARDARYQALQRQMRLNSLLLTGQHSDDQAETVLLQLFRGAGPQGLAAMPRHKKMGPGHLGRPLLGLTRAQLLDYARQYQLHWVEDESNQVLRFARNRVRQQILPLVHQHFKGVKHCLARSARLCAQSQQLLQDLAGLDYAKVATPDQQLYSAPLQALSRARQANLIRYWLQQHHLPCPTERKLNALLAQLTAREDAQPCIEWPGVTVRRFQGIWYATTKLASPSHYLPNVAPHWDLRQPLYLPNGQTLKAQLTQGTGLIQQAMPLRVGFRQGGERCKPAGYAHSRPLKKWLQDFKVPPWQRHSIPLLYYQHTLVAVVGYFICHGWQVNTAKQSGYMFYLEE